MVDYYLEMLNIIEEMVDYYNKNDDPNDWPRFARDAKVILDSMLKGD